MKNKHTHKTVLTQMFTLETSLGRGFAILIQLLIIISLVGFSISTLPDLSPKTVSALRILEAVIVGVFTFEYLARIYTTPHRLRYIFSFWGIIDLAAILPFYLATGLDLRSVRAFRLLRIARILKLARYTTALDRLIRAFRDIRDELILFGVLSGIILYLSAVGIYYFENTVQPEAFSSVFDSLWWAVATLTTVGYGDVYPVTPGGKIFTFVILVLGLGIVAIPTGLLASSLSNQNDNC